MQAPFGDETRTDLVLRILEE